VTVLVSVQDAKEEKKEKVLFLKKAKIKRAHVVKTMGFCIGVDKGSLV